VVSSGVTDPNPATTPATKRRASASSRADADNDLGTDLFLRHAASGATSVWLMNGVTRLSAGAIDPQPATTLEIFGVDDFNADHRNDLVLRDTITGAVEFSG